jgi:hypothetical protein
MIPKRATKYVFPTVRVITQWILVVLVGFFKKISYRWSQDHSRVTGGCGPVVPVGERMDGPMDRRASRGWFFSYLISNVRMRIQVNGYSLGPMDFKWK